MTSKVQRRHTETLSVKSGDYPREYYSLRTDNELDSNLTELNAATSVDAGFINHTDWSGHVMRYGAIAKWLGDEQPETVLDVGCGTLQLAYFLWKNRFAFGADYWGIDLRAKPTWISPEQCKIKTSVNLVQGDVVLDDFSCIPTWPGQFDAVVCTETFEHVPRSHAPVLMTRLYEWTAPGGVCYLSTPNAGVSDSTADNHIDKGNGESREWTYKDKLALARETGFVVEKTYGAFGQQKMYKPRLQAMPAMIPTGAKNADGTPEYREGNMWEHPLVQNAKSYFNHSWFCTFLAATFPAASNNAMFKMRRPR